MGIFGGLIAGGLAGAGASVENTTGEMIKTQSAMDLEKLRGSILAEREMQVAKYKSDLADKPRQEVLAEASKPVQFRSVDGEGNPYDDSMVDKSPGRMASIAAGLGHADLAQKLRAAGEPGFKEQHAITAAEQEQRDNRQSQQRIAEKGVPQAQTAAQTNLTQAQADSARAQGRYAGVHADNEAGRPGREAAAENRRVAAELLKQSKELGQEALKMQQAFTADFGGVPVEKLTEGQKRERAQRMIELDDVKRRSREASDTANSLLRRSGGGPLAGVTEDDVLGRDPVRSEEPPIDGAYLKDGFWYGPDKTPVITRSGRPVRKSLDEKNDTNLTDAVDRDASGARVESAAPAASRGLLGGEAPAGGKFSRAEQELIDEQTSLAGKTRVRNEIMRQRQIDARRRAAAQAEEEAQLGASEYAKRGIDPRSAAH